MAVARARQQDHANRLPLVMLGVHLLGQAIITRHNRQDFTVYEFTGGLYKVKETLTDEALLDLFRHVVKQLSGLIVQEHSDGRLLMFTDEQRRLKHAVYNINENNWGCFCPDALDGECVASTYARVRLMRHLED